MLHRVALGEMGMPLRDFEYLTPWEFNQAIRGHRDRVGREVDNQLWQTRYLAAMTLTASMKVKKMIKPRDLFKLPGERKILAERKVTLTPEEVRQHIENLNRRAAKNSPLLPTKR